MHGHGRARPALAVTLPRASSAPRRQRRASALCRAAGGGGSSQGSASGPGPRRGARARCPRDPGARSRVGGAQGASRGHDGCTGVPPGLDPAGRRGRRAWAADARLILPTLSEGNPDQGEWDAIRASPPSTTAVTPGTVTLVSARWCSGSPSVGEPAPGHGPGLRGEIAVQRQEEQVANAAPALRRPRRPGGSRRRRAGTPARLPGCPAR